MIDFSCHVCGKHVRVKDEAAGQRGKCKACGELLVVPTPMTLVTRKVTPPAELATVPAPDVAPQIVPTPIQATVISGPIARRWCPTCNAGVIAAKTEPSHLLHFFLSLVTFGMWVVIWILCVIAPQYNCGECGSNVYGSRYGYWLTVGVKVFLAVVALFVFGRLFAM